MHLIHTNQQPDYMAEMVELTATSSSWSGLWYASYLLYQKPALKTKSVSEPSVMPALLRGTVFQTIFSLSQTPNISRNFSKPTCLHCHF